MGRTACRGRAGWWRAVFSMLLAVGGLAACGSEQSDPALATAAVAAQAPPADKAECRRWTTCVPENPCHTGWVTGCRAGVPVCTDIGGWLSNGTTCGTDQVCYLGECEPCKAGESCVFARDMYGNPDTCRLGAIACGSGQPVCEYQGPAPDGTACMGGGPYVCKGGECTYCVEGQIGCIPPEGPCHEGRMTSCATGGTCVATGNLFQNGTICANDGSVCRDGDCVTCPYGQCQPEGMPCYDGYVTCWSGWPACNPQMPKPDGTPCEGGVCRFGACVQPCVPDQPCTLNDGCLAGRTVCDPFYGASCQPVAPVPDGTPCPYGICNSGSCSPCGPTTWCQSPTPCFGSGTISCATGACEPTPPPFAGAMCGLGGETCNADGVCTDDADARLLVRSASWMADLTDTTWTRCSSDGSGSSSQRNTDTYGVGTITHVEETFATPDCTGDPLTSRTVNGTVTSAGDRYVTWAGGMPPPGVPFWSVTATAVRVTGVDPVEGPIDFKFLIWVNDGVAPRQLFQGEQDHSLAWDGYPALLVAETHPLQELVAPCVPEQPCTPSNECRSGRTVCDPFLGTVCQEREPLPDGTPCTWGVCVAGWCSSCGPSTWCPSPTPCYGSGTISCATGACEPSPPPFAGSTCGVGGETCSAEGACVDDGDPRPIARSTYGSVALAGTKWSACMRDEPEPGMSRLRIDTYGEGTITHEEVVFTQGTGCAGATDPARGLLVQASLTSAGDRLVTWAGGMPPPGLPGSLTATGVHVAAADTPIGPIEFNDVLFVNDAVAPRQLFQGETDHSLAWDGYPTLLVADRPMTEVLACNAGEPCSPGYPTCEVWAIDCSGGVPACGWTGTYLPEGARCGDFLECRSNACVPVPTRTVTGTSLMTYWPDGGPVATMDPAPLYWVAALQFASTGFVTRPGMIFPDGSFAIPDVAEGPYQLEIGTPNGLVYVALSAQNVVDLGVDVLGRQDVAVAATPPTDVWFDVKGLVPWARGDVLEFASSNAGVAALPFGGQEATTQPVGAVQLTGPFSWLNRPLVDGAAGDVAYVFQASTTAGPTGERVTAASGWADLWGPGFAFLDGVGGTVDVSLLSCPGRGAISADWRRGEFEAYLGQIHPDAFPVNHRLVVGARPHASPFAPGFRVGELAQYPGVPLLVVQASPDPLNPTVVLADLGYGRFLPPLWREYRHDRLMAAVNFRAPGAVGTARLNAPLGYDVAADAVAGDPIAPFVVAPVVTPPLNLMIEGQDAWNVVGSVGTTPRISWTAPTLSPAAAALFPGASLQYTVTAYQVRLAPDGVGTQVVRLFEAKTTRTAYRLPGTNMFPGGTFVVAVAASLTAESLDAPRRQSIEEAFATVVSREFTP